MVLLVIISRENLSTLWSFANSLALLSSLNNSDDDRVVHLVWRIFWKWACWWWCYDDDDDDDLDDDLDDGHGDNDANDDDDDDEDDDDDDDAGHGDNDDEDLAATPTTLWEPGSRQFRAVTKSWLIFPGDHDHDGCVGQ